MPCFGRKRVEVMPVEEGADGPMAAAEKKIGTGRMETTPDSKKAGDAHSSSDRGLQSAPSGQDSEKGPHERVGVHSAPQRAALSKARQPDDLGDFLIEGTGDAGPTAVDIDQYLEGLFGPRIVKDLRSHGAHTEWASRVSGLEALQRIVKAKKAEGEVAATPTGDGANWRDEGERLALFRGLITVLARALSDKVVPVFLPAIALLTEVYSREFFALMPSSSLPKKAVALFASQLIFRSGSSNARAIEESSQALLHLARCDAVGCDAVAPWVTRPISNTKQAHAVVSRLELLRTLLSEFDLGRDHSGLELEEVLKFALPLCEVASGAAREAAMALLLDLRALDVPRAERLINQLRPAVLTLIHTRLNPPEPKAADAASVTGRKALPPIGARAPSTPGGHDAHSGPSVKLGSRGPPATPKKGSQAQMKRSQAANDEQSASTRVLSFEVS